MVSAFGAKSSPFSNVATRPTFTSESAALSFAPRGARHPRHTEFEPRYPLFPRRLLQARSSVWPSPPHVLTELFQIGAHAECRARSGDDDSLKAVVLSNLFKGLDQTIQNSAAQGIASLGAIQPGTQLLLDLVNIYLQHRKVVLPWTPARGPLASWRTAHRTRIRGASSRPW